MDIPFLIEALARSPNDPGSIHPALLNAICLVACCVAGGRLFTFKEYFLEQTRLGLERSLADANRLTHFLWASVVLGNFFTNCGRSNESYAIVSAAARFALACGLDGITTQNNSSTPEVPLLPRPANRAEADDRRRLSHAIYMTDRSLAMLSGLPSEYRTAPSTVQRGASSTAALEENSIDNASRTVSISCPVCSIAPRLNEVEQPLDMELSEIVDSELPLNMVAMQLYERVERFARQTNGATIVMPF